MNTFVTFSAELKEREYMRPISFNIPVVYNNLSQETCADSRWARHNVYCNNLILYPLSEINEAYKDFKKLVDFVNASQLNEPIDRYKDGLLKIVDEHITKYGRLLFGDLLMYVDSLAYLCYSSDLMTEEIIQQNYASWVKFIVDKRKNSIMCKQQFIVGPFIGSKIEEDYNYSLISHNYKF